MDAALATVPMNGTAISLKAFRAKIAKISDPKDAADFARKCEAAAKLCSDNEAQSDLCYQAAVYARMKSAELVDAGRKAGLIQKNGGDRKKISLPNSKLISVSSLLNPFDVSKNEKLRLAGGKVVESYFAACSAKQKRITSSGAIAAAKKYLRDKSLKQKEGESMPAGFTVTGQQDVVSCDAVITDPPYGITSEPWEPKDLEKFTRDWLSRWDEANAAWFVSFFSQARVWEMRRWMDDELRGYEFYHLCIWHYGNGMGHKGGILKESWEPIFVYRRRDVVPVRGEWDWNSIKNLDCVVEGAPRPTFEGAAEQRHPCQKPVGVMAFLATAFCEKGGLIVDPFCGSGTTGIAARRASRRFHGIETDAAYRKLAKSRIGLFGEAV